MGVTEANFGEYYLSDGGDGPVRIPYVCELGAISLGHGW